MTTNDRTLGQDAWAAVGALLALLLLVPLAVFTPWLVVLGAPVVLLGRVLARRRAHR